MAVATATRYVASAPLALIMTVFLFLGMRVLIETEDIVIPQTAPPPQYRITQDDIQTDVRLRERPTPPVDVKAPPPPPRIEPASTVRPNDDSLIALGTVPNIDPEVMATPPVDTMARTQRLRPLVRVEPNYPSSAASRGLEGDCLMTFDVNPDGTVAAPSIVADCTSSAFANAATRAVRGWKYQPEVRNGQGVMRHGVQTELNFRMAQ